MVFYSINKKHDLYPFDFIVHEDYSTESYSLLLYWWQKDVFSSMVQGD